MNTTYDMREIERLDCLDDDLVEAVLAMSPDDAMEDVSHDDILTMVANVANADAMVARNRLTLARTAVQNDARGIRPSASIHGAKTLKNIRANDAVFNERLTLAARNGNNEYEADRAGIEADLEELRQDEEREGIN